MENLGVELFAGEGKYKFVGHRSDEFPTVPTLENTAIRSTKRFIACKCFQ